MGGNRTEREERGITEGKTGTGLPEAPPAGSITAEKLEKYLDITARAIKKVRITEMGIISWKAAAEDFLDMATRYHSDAGYFMKKGDYVNAFAAVNYAHGWLDAGARLGLFDVGHDNKLFTVE